jgi:hypothetical protein
MRWLVGLCIAVAALVLTGQQPAHANSQCVSLVHPSRAADRFLLCFAIGEDNRIYSNVTHESERRWTGWKVRSGVVQGNLDCTAHTIAPSPGGSRRDWFRVDCFARAADGSLRQVIDGGDASTAEGVSMALPAALLGDPSCTSSSGQVYCFGRNDRNQLMSNTGLIGRGWLGWANLEGIMTQDPECVRGAAGMTHCFVRNSERAISVIGCSGFSGSGRCPRAWLNGDGILEGQLSCVAQRRPDGAPGTQPNFDCFVRGTDSAVHQIRYSNGAFGPWRRLNPGRIAGDPACVVTGEDRYLCAARTEAGRLQMARFDGTRWSDWAQVTDRPISGTPHCVFSAGANETACTYRDLADGQMRITTFAIVGGWRNSGVPGLRLRE